MRLLIAAILTTLALAAWFNPSEMRRRLVADAATLPVSFAHADHREENCIDCHHNFNDQTGDGLCLDCHERSQAVAHLLEDQFHGLCRTCHAQRQAEGLPHGPTRRCLACHVADAEP